MFNQLIRGKRGIQAVLLSMLVGLFLLFAAPEKTLASGSVNVSVSSASGDVGSQVTVNINVSADGAVSGTDFEVNFDPSVLSPADGSGGSTAHIADISTYTDKTFSLTFNVVGAGSSSVSVASSSAQFISEDEDVMAVSASSGTVTGTVADSGNSGNSGSSDSGNSGSSNSGSSDSGSSGSGSFDSGSSDSGSADSGNSGSGTVLDGNTSLSSLDVYPGSISFSAGTYSYTVDVSSDTDQLQVSAVPASGTSRVSVSDTSLALGDNTVTITVTAENGATAQYVLNVRRGAAETTTQESTTQESTTEETSTEETTTVQTVSVLGTVVSPEKTFDILELPTGVSVPAGFTPVTVTIGGSDYTAYQNSTGMVIFYGRPASDDDTDLSGVGWYSYDASDGSIQAVPEQLLGQTTSTRTTSAAAAAVTSERVVDYRWKGLACVLALVVCLLAVLFIIFVIRGKSGPHDGGDDDWTDGDGNGLDSDLSDGDQESGTSDDFEDLEDDILAGGPDDDDEPDQAEDEARTAYRTLEPDEKTLADGVNRIMSEDDGMETLDIDETTSQK